MSDRQQYTIRDLYRVTGLRPIDVYRWIDRGWLRWQHRGAGHHNKGRAITEKDILVAKALTSLSPMVQGDGRLRRGVALRTAVADALNDAGGEPKLLSITQDDSGRWQAEVRNDPDLSRPSTLVDLDTLRSSIDQELRRTPEQSL